MKNRYLLFVSISWLLIQCSLSAEKTISLYIQPFPHVVTEEKAQAINNKISSPGYIAHKTVKSAYSDQINSGIFSTYAGFLTSSKYDGEIMFPRKHEAPSIIMVITSKIMPVTMMYNTISHWEIEPQVDAEFYTIERKKDDETELFYWDVAPLERPKNNIIPLTSLIIIAQPKNTYVPIGSTLTNDSEQLVLPDIYVKKNIQSSQNSLYILNLKQFFGPIKGLYLKEDKRQINQLVY